MPWVRRNGKSKFRTNICRKKPVLSLRGVRLNSSHPDGMAEILNKRIIRSQLGVQTNVNLSQEWWAVNCSSGSERGSKEPEEKPMVYDWVIIILDARQVLWRRGGEKGEDEGGIQWRMWAAESITEGVSPHKDAAVPTSAILTLNYHKRVQKFPAYKVCGYTVADQQEPKESILIGTWISCGVNAQSVKKYSAGTELNWNGCCPAANRYEH